MRKLSGLFLVIFLIMNGVSAQEIIPFNAANWDMFGGKVDTIEGREAYAGIALLKNVDFTNGTIEWDLLANGGRSYAGVVFHFQPNRDSEEFYIRPHKANGLNADAFQYCPVYHGVSCWQLSHGQGATREAALPFNEWVHFKISVKGSRAEISMGNNSLTTMIIDKLNLGEIPGRIGVKGPADGSAWFSNFRWSPEVNIDFPEPRQYHQPEPGIINNWEITQPITHDRVDQYRYYDKMEGLEWNDIEADRDGLINLTKAVVRNPSLPGWLYARAIITSETEGLHKYQLGYSDYVTVFINGKPIMSSTNGYTSRDPGFAGLIGYFDEIFLPLKKGENEICLLIGEQFGGWGFMVRDGEAVRLADGVKKVWELKSDLNFPESVVYDEGTGFLYVSNIITPTGGGISKVTIDGKIIDPEWVKGLRSPTGITISGDNIYVVERGGVAVIEKNSGEITERIELEGSLFPNDITGSDDGSFFVSDNEANRIYRLRDGEPTVWMDGGDLKKPNGIESRDGFLYVGCTGDARLRKINISTKESTVIARIADGSVMDGLQVLEDGTVIFSDYVGHLFCLSSEGDPVEIINTISTQVQLADFEYIPEKKMIIVPGLYSNVLSAYSLQGYLE